MDNRLKGKIVGIGIAILGLGLMITRHPVLVVLVVIGATIYYLSERIF